MKIKYLLTADWELTDERIKIALPPLQTMQRWIALSDENRDPQDVFDRVFFLGDLLRTFTTNTTTVARRALEKHNPLLLCGNHDYATGIDRLTAIFEGVPGAEIVKEPKVEVIDNVAFAFLPAPDRQAFGAARKAEGARARDLALSEALESAIIALETSITGQGIPIGNAFLFFHGTLEGVSFGNQIATGLTWTIPEARLINWGGYWGGHIHKPGPHYVGTIAPFTFGEVVPEYRAISLTVDTETGDFDSVELPLRQSLDMLELTFETFEAGQFTNELLRRLETDWESDFGAQLSLKVRAKMSTAMFSAVPRAPELRAILEKRYPGQVYDVKLLHEPTETRAARLTGEAKRLPIVDLFLEFLAVNNIEASPEAVDLAVAKLPLITQALSFNEDPESLFEFEPLNISLRNFRQWGEARLDFTTLEGTVSITGPNYSGKSNLLEAVLFALFKRSPASEAGIEHELRNGETSGEVVLEFLACGNKYKVSRSLEAGKSGVSCKTELLKLVPCLTHEAIDSNSNVPLKWGPVGELTSGEMQKEIERLVGSYEFVTSTFISTQKDADKLLKSTPTEWGRLLIEALALGRYRAFYDYAKEKEAELNKENEKADAVIDNLEGQILIEKETLERFSAPEMLERKAALEARQASAESSIEHLNGKIVTLEDEREKLNKDLGEAREKVGALSGLTDRAGKIERELTGIVKTLAAGLGEAPASPVISSQHYEGLVAAAEASLKAANDKLEENKTALREQRGWLQQANSWFENLNRNIERVKLEIETLDKNPLPDVPCESQRADLYPSIKDKCPAYAALTGTTRRESMAKELQEFEAEWSKYRKKVSDFGLEIAIVEKLVYENGYKAESTRSGLESLRADLKEARDAEAAFMAYEARGEALERERRRKDELEVERLEVSAKIKELEPLKDMVNNFTERVGSLGRELNIEKENLRESRKAKQEAFGALVDLEKDRITSEKILERLEARKLELEGGRSDNARELLAFELIARAFHNTGIPFLLMEQAADLFEAQVNKFLEPTEFSIEVLTQKPTKEGVVRDKVNIYFYDTRGRHPLSFASGMQTSTFKLTIGAGVASLGSLFMGLPPRIFTQDEGWETFEEEKRPLAIELINLISKEFKTFFFIAHLPEISTSADIRLKVVVDNGESSLVRV